VRFAYTSADEYVEMTKDLVAPVKALMADETGERRAEVWAKVAAACGPYSKADGSIEMENEAICVWGRR